MNTFIEELNWKIEWERNISSYRQHPEIVHHFILVILLLFKSYSNFYSILIGKENIDKAISVRVHLKFARKMDRNFCWRLFLVEMNFVYQSCRNIEARAGSINNKHKTEIWFTFAPCVSWMHALLFINS